MMRQALTVTIPQTAMIVFIVALVATITFVSMRNRSKNKRPLPEYTTALSGDLVDDVFPAEQISAAKLAEDAARATAEHARLNHEIL